MGRQRKGSLKSRKWFWLLTDGKYKFERVIEKGMRRNGLRLHTERWVMGSHMMTTEMDKGGR